MIGRKKKVTLEEFRAFVERHPHLQNQTKIIQYLSREMEKKKKQQVPTLTEHTYETPEDPEIPILDEDLSKKMGKRKNRYFPIKKPGFMACYSKYKMIRTLSIILLCVICFWVFRHTSQQSPTMTEPHSVTIVDIICNDSLSSDTIQQTADSISMAPVDSSNINLSTPKQAL